MTSGPVLLCRASCLRFGTAVRWAHTVDDSAGVADPRPEERSQHDPSSEGLIPATDAHTGIDEGNALICRTVRTHAVALVNGFRLSWVHSASQGRVGRVAGVIGGSG